MNKAKNDQQLTLEILQLLFPMECSMAGEANVVNISNGGTEQIRATGGSNFDISHILTVLGSAAGFVSTAITICKALKKEKKTIPTPIEVKVVVENKIGVSAEIGEENKIKICRLVSDEIVTGDGKDRKSK